MEGGERVGAARRRRVCHRSAQEDPWQHRRVAQAGSRDPRDDQEGSNLQHGVHVAATPGAAAERPPPSLAQATQARRRGQPGSATWPARGHLPCQPRSGAGCAQFDPRASKSALSYSTPAKNCTKLIAYFYGGGLLSALCDIKDTPVGTLGSIQTFVQASIDINGVHMWRNVKCFDSMRARANDK